VRQQTINVEINESVINLPCVTYYLYYYSWVFIRMGMDHKAQLLVAGCMLLLTNLIDTM